MESLSEESLSDISPKLMKINENMLWLWLAIITLLFGGVYIAVTYKREEEPDVLTNQAILPRRKLWTNNKACVLIRSEDMSLCKKTAESLINTGTGIFIRIFSYGDKTGGWPSNVKVETVPVSDVLPTMEELVLMVEDRSILAVQGGVLFASDPSPMFNHGSMIWLDHTPDKYFVGENSHPGSVEPKLLEEAFLIDKQADKHAASMMRQYPFQKCWSKKMEYKIPHLLGEQKPSFRGTHRLIGHESEAVIILQGTGDNVIDFELPDKPWQVQSPIGKLTCDRITNECFYSEGKIVHV